MTKKVGLIGTPIGHSKSPYIHAFFHNIPYHLYEKEGFLALDDAGVIGLNVTAPYKKEAYEKADMCDAYSHQSKSVNTLVKKEGKLFGYNTDILALKEILEKAIKKYSPKSIAILGNGATSRSVQIALEKHSHIQICIYARHPKGLETHWDDWKDIHDFIIQTTPLGMNHGDGHYPFNEDALERVKWIFDIVYNPFHTPLLEMAKRHNIPYLNGLPMLIKQARYSAELFIQKKIDKSLEKRVYRNVLMDATNIVLIGMPYSGKSTLGKALSETLNRPFIDTDDLIFQQSKYSPKQWIENKGEKVFRKIEEKMIQTLKDINGYVIATGGGSVLSQKNQSVLAKNSLIVWLNYEGTPHFDHSRPLSSTLEQYLKIKNERIPLYRSLSDITIDFNKAVTDVKSVWEGVLNDYIHSKWS